MLNSANDCESMETLELETVETSAVDVLKGCVSREQILHLESSLVDALKQAGKDFTPGCTDDEFPVTHHFAPGLYAREIFIPAGHVIIGKIHRHSHVNTISKGSVIVATEFGTKELKAPMTFVSQPGTKRAVYAYEDTVWTTYHPTEEVDLEKIEAYVIAPTFEAYEQGLLK